MGKKITAPKRRPTERRARAALLEAARLAWLDAGGDRLLVDRRWAQALARSQQGGRDIPSGERAMLARLHRYALRSKRSRRRAQKSWDGSYLKWAKDVANAQFLARYRSFIELHLARRFPDTRAGAKQFTEFLETLQAGEILANFSLPSDRSNPIDAMSWEVGYLVGRATEALYRRFSTPDRTGVKIGKTVDIRNRALEAARAWREDDANRSRRAPICDEIIPLLPGVKSIASGGAGSEPMKAKLHWDDRTISVGRFHTLWSEWRRRPDFKTALRLTANGKQFTVSA